MNRLSVWDGVRIAFSVVLIILALKIFADGWILTSIAKGDLTVNSIALSFLAIALAVLISAGDGIARVFSDASTRELTATVEDIKRMSVETASKVDRLLEMAQASPRPAVVSNYDGTVSPEVVIQNRADGTQVEQGTTPTDIVRHPVQAMPESLPRDE